MQESVALDTSHESSRGTTRLPSPEPDAENDEFSDWDSWEDENEVRFYFSKGLELNEDTLLNFSKYYSVFFN